MRKTLFLMLLLMALLGGQLLVTAQSCTDFNNAADYYNRADSAYDQRLFEDVITDMTCAIQLAPNEARYYNMRGNAYYRLKQYPPAREDYDKTLELDPQAYYVYNNLANLYYVIGDYDKSLEYYTLSLDSRSNTGSLEISYTNRGSLYLEIYEYEKARADFVKALEYNSNYDYAHLGLATLYQQQGEQSDAATAYYRWVQIIEENPRTPAYTANRSYEVRIVTGDTNYISLPLQAGDELSVSANETDKNQRVDPLLVLIDPSGQAIVADDDSGINFNAVINNYVASTSGEYTLILTHSGGHYLAGVDGLVNFSIQVRRDGTVTELPTPTPVAATSATAPTATPEASTELTAGTFASYRLFPNVLAEVTTTEGDRLNLRSGPGLTFDILAKLNDGTIVRLIEGPRKEEGLQWWRVRTQDGQEGWAVERVDEEQTLVMALLVGEDAIVVTEDERLNVRESAGRGATRLFQLVDGDRITLLEVPQFADGYRWWKVRTQDGREGWLVDQIEGVRTIVPAKERD